MKEKDGLPKACGFPHPGKAIFEKRTLKAIQTDIKTLETQLDDIKDIRKHCPELVKLEEQIQKIKENYREEINAQVNCWESDIQQLNKELKDKKEDNKLQLSEKVEKWFRHYKSGVSWGYKEPKIVWISPDERFAIITAPGSTAGQGTAMGTGGYYYASSTHWLTEIVENGTYSSMRRDGVASLKEMEFEGRLTKEIKAKMIARAEELAGYSYQ
jgi:hypothetical protein